jgi:general secretion pathway protein D
MTNHLLTCSLLLVTLSGCMHNPKSMDTNSDKFSTANEVKKQVSEKTNSAKKIDGIKTEHHINDLSINGKIQQLLSMKVGQQTMFEKTNVDARDRVSNLSESEKKIAKEISKKGNNVELDMSPGAKDARQLLEMNEPVEKKSEDETISINMYEARIDQLLWTLADKLKLNLIVEPKILAMTEKASINIKNVKISDAIAITMETFDLHAEIKGNALNVKSMEDRVYNLEILNAKSNIKVDTGGDVLGAGGKDGGGALKGNVSLNMNAGESEDAFSYIEKTVESIIQDGDDKANKPRFNLNKSSGTLYVHAKPSRVKVVSEFLKKTKEIQGRQVQIDVQLVDIKLNDTYSMGIDWTHFTNNLVSVVGSTTGLLSQTSSKFPIAVLGERTLTIPQQILGNPGVGGGGSLLFGNGKYSAVINALGVYGNAQLVSNPSLRMRNGIPAYISVGTNYKIVTKVSTTSSNTGSGSSLSSDVQTDSIFSGVVMAVTAQIKDDSSIELFIHPTQSRAREDKLGLVQVSANASVTLPIIDTKSIATTLSINNNDTVILGGLVDQQSADNTKGVPGFSDIPLMGALFRNNQNISEKRELIIILRARLL